MSRWESNPKLAEIAKFSVIEGLTITAKELGRGSYGTVYAAVHSGKPCVAKELHCFLKHDKLEPFVREINTLSTLKHPSIVQFLGVYFKEKSQTPILVMEMMWKNLYSLLEEQPKKLFLLTKAHILYDVACGLQYLHAQKKPVIHWDLHPSNILLNENLNAKIADFGAARPVSSKLTCTPGNIAYMAPETLKRKSTFDTKVDVFSLGCTIIHLVTEKFPAPTDQFIESVNLDGPFQKVSEVNRRIEFLKLMDHVPVLKQLTCQCLENAPTNRPLMGYICSELEKYIHRLESEAPELAEQHNKDKFSLLQLLQHQRSQLERKAKLIEDVNKDKSMLTDSIAKNEECISSLESQCKDLKSKLVESEFTILSLNQSKDSMQKELTDLEKVNKDWNMTYKNQMALLREDVKAKQQEIKAAGDNKIQMQNDIEDLQDKLKTEKFTLSQKLQQVTDLQNDMEKIKADAEEYKQEKDQLVMANLEYEVQIKALEQQVNILQSRLEEKDKQIEVVVSEKDSIDEIKLQMQNEIEVNKNLTTTYKNQVNQLKEKIKTKEEEVKCLTIDNEGHKLKLSALEVEVINLKDHVKAKQEELNKGAIKIKLLEKVAGNSTNNEN